MREWSEPDRRSPVDESPTPVDDAAPPTPAWKRYALIGTPLIVAALVVLYLYWDEIQIRGWINRLSNSDARVRREQREALKGHEDKALVDKLLLEAVEDDGKTFDVRSSCARLLLERQRLPMLEAAFARGSVETRGLILRAFSKERWFKKFVEDQGGVVEETVRTWIRDGSDTTRSHAIQLAVQLDLSDVMPAIRKVLMEPRAQNVHPDILRDLTISAAGAVERFEDCESLPRVAELAENHRLSLVRLRCMQIVDRSVFRGAPGAKCPGAVPPETMKRIVDKALDDTDRTVRMGAMLILQRKPEWAPEVAERLQTILDGDGNGAERRQALETLAGLDNAAFQERYPRYFHDPMAEVRSSAARVAATMRDRPRTGALAGVLQDEVESEVMWTDAAKALRHAAGTWKGLTKGLRTRPSIDPKRWSRDLVTLFTTGELEDLTRDAWADAWFRWWAEKLELTPEQVEKAAAARKAFFDAKSRNDTAAAEAALDSAGIDVPGLFDYERGWLQSR